MDCRVKPGNDGRSGPGAAPTRRLFSRPQSCGKYGAGNGEKDAQKGRFESGEEIQNCNQEERRGPEKTPESCGTKKSKPAKKKSIAKKTLKTKSSTAKKISNPPPESFPHKIARAFNAIVDTLTDAEHLDHQLDPGVSREPE
jgi:hypothetical protein